MTESNPRTTHPDLPELPEVRDVTQTGDHTSSLVRAARFGLIGVSIILVLSVALWGAIAQLPGVWGVLIGGALGGSFMLLTVFVVMWTSRATPTVTLAVVLGSWLLKIAVCLVIMLIIQDMSFYHRPALAVTVLLTLITALATETYAVTKTQRLYVS